MRKTNAKRTMALLAAAAMCFGQGGVRVLADETEILTEIGGVLPMNVAVVSTSTDLSMDNSGTLNCYGYVEVQSGYTAGITVALQKKDGGWSTIKTWNESGDDTAEVDEDYSAEKGYSYRLKVTYKAYSSSGTLVESIVKYSNTVS